MINAFQLFIDMFSLLFIMQLVQKPVKIKSSNIVVFCMFITILNTLLITMQNVLHLLHQYIKIEIYHYFLKYLKR